MSIDRRKELYDALCNDDTLCTMLAQGADSVSAYYEDDMALPCIIVQEISDTPAQFTDDDESAARIRLQITIVTTNDEYDEIEQQVKTIIRVLGYTRQLSTVQRDNDKFYRILQYIAVN